MKKKRRKSAERRNENKRADGPEISKSTHKIKFEYEYDDDGIAIPIITKEIFIESFKEALEILKKEAWERGG